MGDTFGHYQYDGAVVYLSRFEQSRSTKKKLPRKPIFKLLAAAVSQAGEEDSDDENVEPGTPVFNTFETVAEQLYFFSLHQGPEIDIIQEGAIKVRRTTHPTTQPF